MKSKKSLNEETARQEGERKMAEGKVFLVEGEIALRGKRQRFSKKVKAESSAFAAEKVLCLFGSKNKLKRNNVFLQEVKEAAETQEKDSKKK